MSCFIHGGGRGGILFGPYGLHVKAITEILSKTRKKDVLMTFCFGNVIFRSDDEGWCGLYYFAAPIIFSLEGNSSLLRAISGKRPPIDFSG